MSKPIHITDKGVDVANNLIALLGLLVLGFPATSAALKTTVASWVLSTIATMQLVLRYLRPHIRFQEMRRESN